MNANERKLVRAKGTRFLIFDICVHSRSFADIK
jgi:hypothetical protein